MLDVIYEIHGFLP